MLSQAHSAMRSLRRCCSLSLDPTIANNVSLKLVYPEGNRLTNISDNDNIIVGAQLVSLTKPDTHKESQSNDYRGGSG